jgi:hypothetical protein
VGVSVANRMHDAMKIHFCDLCNESVPEGDFSTGKAFRREGRVICSTCDAVMTSHDAFGGAGGATLPPPRLAPPVAGAAEVGQAAAEVRARGSWMGAAALLLAVGSAWFFSGQLADIRDRERGLREVVDQELNGVGRDLDGFSLSSKRRDEELEGRLRRDLTAGRADVEVGLGALRGELKAAQQQLASIDNELVRQAGVQREGEVEAGRRIDDLLAQSMQSRQALDSLATRLEQNEQALAQERARPSASPDRPSGPKYAAEIADLASGAASTRWNAVQSLGETGDPGVVPHLIPLLGDSDVFVRMAVARVFGDLASPLSIEPLISALEDEESVMREAAMASLHIITGRDFRFDPFAKPAERAKRVAAWRDWWKKARDEYFGDL